MNSDCFSINGRYELLALHRGLMEARFCENPNDLDVSGSPILAKIHREVVGALLALDQPVGGSFSQWSEWLSLDGGRREWKIAVARAVTSNWWWKLDDLGKLEAARDLLSPFIISDQKLQEFILLVDSSKGNEL